MSRRHDDVYVANTGFLGLSGAPFSSNILNLIIFILIVLQFGTRKDGIFGGDECEDHGHGNEIDNSILFIIALFFLFVCSCGSNDGCGCGFTGYGRRC